MKKLSYLSASFVILCLAACSSKDKAGPKRVEQEPVAWDYNKIREVREEEKVQTPPVPENSSDEEANCVVMTKSQMTRAKKSGCRKLDPRGGQGDSYCCPRE